MKKYVALILALLIITSTCLPAFALQQGEASTLEEPVIIDAADLEPGAEILSMDDIENPEEFMMMNNLPMDALPMDTLPMDEPSLDNIPIDNLTTDNLPLNAKPVFEDIAPDDIVDSMLQDPDAVINDAADDTEVDIGDARELDKRNAIIALVIIGFGVVGIFVGNIVPAKKQKRKHK